MKILLTGGTGFIGAAVLERLVAADHQVTAIVRSQQSSLKVEAAGATGVIGDLFDAQWLASELSTHDAAIHTAAGGDGSDPQLDDSVIDAVISAFGGTTKPYLHTGGIWVYGNGSAIAEDSPLAPPELTAWRTEREKRVLESEVNASVVQPAIVYGRGQGIANTITQAPRTDDGALLLIGSGDQHWTTVHVDDVADLYVLALGAPGGQVYIAASGDNPTVRELGQAVADQVAPDDVESTRERLGGAFADALLLDQQARGESARHRLGWEPTRPSLVEQLRSGYADAE